MRRTLFVALLLAASAVAQSPSAPPLSPDAMVLYAHNEDGSDELVGWSNALQADGTDVAMGPAGNCGTHSANGPQQVNEVLIDQQGTTIDRWYELPVLPTQLGTLRLTPGAPIKALLHIGAGTCTGKVDLTSTLEADGVVVATGSMSGHYYHDAGSAAYPRATFDMAVEQSAVQITDTLVWKIHVTGKTMGSLFMSVSEGRGFTRLELPVEAFEPAGSVAPATTHFEDRPEGPQVVSHNFTQPTGDTYQYNWTSTIQNASISISVNVEQGSVSVALFDGDGAEAYNQTWSEAATDARVIDGPAAGTWHLHVRFSDFIGSLNMTIHEEGTDPPEPSATGGTTTTGTSTTPTGTGGNSTTTTAPPADEESPGLPAVAAAAALGVAAWLRRRT